MKQRVRWAVAACAILVVNCSDSNDSDRESAPDTADEVLDAEDTASDGEAPVDVDNDTKSPPDATDGTDGTDTAVEDVTEPDTTEVTPHTGWQAIPMGANGALQNVRFFDGAGFRVVGANATILRPLGAGWVREWSPHSKETLHDVGGDESALHAVGSNGTWLTRTPIGKWTTWQKSIDVNLHGITSLTDGIVAVGDGGTVIRRNGDDLAYEQKNPDYDLVAVSSPGQSQAFASANGGRVIQRAATAEECPAMFSSDLCAPCQSHDECQGKQCIKFAGHDSASCTRSCATDGCPPPLVCQNDLCQPKTSVDWFKTEVADANITLHGIFALDPANVWAVGDKGRIYRYSGVWTQEENTLPSTKALYGVGGGAGRLYAVGENGTFLSRVDTGQWKSAEDLEGPLLLSEAYRSIAIGGDTAIAVGDDGVIQTKILPDGNFKDTLAAPQVSLKDVYSTGNTMAAVGELGLMVLMNDDGYGALDTPTTQTLNAVQVTSNNAIWAAGNQGTILRLTDKGQFTQFSAGTSANLHGVLADTDDDLLFVGQVGVAITLDAKTGNAQVQSTGQSQDLLDLFSANGTPIAVGRKGTVLKHEGDAWKPLPVSSTADLHAGAWAGEHAVAVGAHGVIVYWDDTDKPEITVFDPAAIYYGVRVMDDGKALMVGWGGVVHQRLSNGNIDEFTVPTNHPLYGIVKHNDQWLTCGSNGQLWTYVPEED